MTPRGDDPMRRRPMDLVRQPHSSPFSVLFVDPSRKEAEQLARALPQGTPIAFAPTGAAALQALGVRVPLLLVSELHLPDISGIDLLTRVHTLPATKHVLLVVVTSNTTVAAKIAAFQAGADDYLVKPVDPGLFLTHVRLVSLFRQVRPD